MEGKYALLKIDLNEAGQDPDLEVEAVAQEVGLLVVAVQGVEAEVDQEVQAKTENQKADLKVQEIDPQHLDLGLGQDPVQDQLKRKMETETWMTDKKEMKMIKPVNDQCMTVRFERAHSFSIFIFHDIE